MDSEIPSPFIVHLYYYMLFVLAYLNQISVYLYKENGALFAALFTSNAWIQLTTPI